MREPKTTDENIVYHGWVDATYRKCRAWQRLSHTGSDRESDEAEYRESIGAVKAFRVMLEALFNWPDEELDTVKSEIYDRVRAEFADSGEKASNPSRHLLERIVPIKGKTYRNHGGGEFICVDILCDEQPVGGVMRRVSDGYTLKAHDICEYPNGTIQWAYSTGGHWPDSVPGKENAR